MAFDEVTLFEFDLEGAQFGPKEMDVPDRLSGNVDAGGSDEDLDVEVEAEDESSGPSLGRMIVMAIVVSVVATLIARRLGSSDEDEESTQIEFEDEEKAPEVGP